MEKSITDIYVAAFKEMVDKKAKEIGKVSPYMKKKFIERSQLLITRSSEEIVAYQSISAARAQISTYYDMLSPYWDIGASEKLPHLSN